MAMDDAAPDNQALFEVVVFLNHFNDLRDPRQDWLKIRGYAARAIGGNESFAGRNFCP
jgi:hypothetical protein